MIIALTVIAIAAPRTGSGRPARMVIDEYGGGDEVSVVVEWADASFSGGGHSPSSLALLRKVAATVRFVGAANP